MVCNKCGYQNSQDAVFCSGCGSRLILEELPAAKKSSNMGLILAFFALFLVAGYWLINMDNVSDKSCDHQWVSATCTKPQTCKLCGATTGSVDGHVWIAATYAAPKTCSNCGATEGSRLVADPIYLNELGVSYHEGKIWTRGQTAPSGTYHTNSDARSNSPNIPTCWGNWRTPGHTLGTVKDQAGNKYTYGIFIDGKDSQDYYMEFNLGGKYTKFTGTCACPDRDSAVSSYVYYNADTLYSKYFEVYLDGEYIGSSPSMRADYSPQKFEFDVTGGNTLKILYPTTGGPNEIASIYDGRLS